MKTNTLLSLLFLFSCLYCEHAQARITVIYNKTGEGINSVGSEMYHNGSTSLVIAGPAQCTTADQDSGNSCVGLSPGQTGNFRTTLSMNTKSETEIGAVNDCQKMAMLVKMNPAKYALSVTVYNKTDNAPGCFIADNPGSSYGFRMYLSCPPVWAACTLVNR